MHAAVRWKGCVFCFLVRSGSSRTLDAPFSPSHPSLRVRHAPPPNAPYVRLPLNRTLGEVHSTLLGSLGVHLVVHRNAPRCVANGRSHFTTFSTHSGVLGVRDEPLGAYIFSPPVGIEPGSTWLLTDALLGCVGGSSQTPRCVCFSPLVGIEPGRLGFLLTS